MVLEENTARYRNTGQRKSQTACFSLPATNGWHILKAWHAHFPWCVWKPGQAVQQHKYSAENESVLHAPHEQVYGHGYTSTSPLHLGRGQHTTGGERNRYVKMMFLMRLKDPWSNLQELENHEEQLKVWEKHQDIRTQRVLSFRWLWWFVLCCRVFFSQKN